MSSHDALVEGPEVVVLLDEDGHAIGTADKATVHHATTPLHLAFSCYLFDEDGQLLVTQRAQTKSVFPGIWTNSVCGHPGPGEPVVRAVARRVASELGGEAHGLRVVLPGFRYQAEMDGIVEYEACPVLVGSVRHAGPWRPDPTEVGGLTWVPWSAFADDVRSGTFAVSPWCALQVEALDALGPDPAQWPDGDEALLPSALPR